MHVFFFFVWYSVLYLWQFCISWSLLATDKCGGSKWGRISSGIQWPWSPTRDTCPLSVNTWFIHDFVTNEPIELQTSVRGQNVVEFHPEFYVITNDHIQSWTSHASDSFPNDTKLEEWEAAWMMNIFDHVTSRDWMDCSMFLQMIICSTFLNFLEMICL